MSLKAKYSDGSSSTRSFTGSSYVVNWNSNTEGDSWNPGEMNRLASVSGGMLWIQGDGGVISLVPDRKHGCFACCVVAVADRSQTMAELVGAVDLARGATLQEMDGGAAVADDVGWRKPYRQRMLNQAFKLV